MSTETQIFVTLGVGAFFALAGGFLALLEVLRTDPLERPTRLGFAGLGLVVVAFLLLSLAYVLIITTTPQPPQ